MPAMRQARKMYLASGSPRRRALMSRILRGRFSVCRHRHEEQMTEGLSPRRLVSRCALSKARSAAERRTCGIVIGADTIVVDRGRILGKPDGAEDAARMLRGISGRTVKVLTAVAVVDIASGAVARGVETTFVTMRRLSRDEIRRYVRTGEPLDKAGAFGIQGKGAALVEKIRGDYENVVGLPLALLRRLLRRVGVFVRREGE
ncbi:MAG: septum formation protein Maf [Planctomycetes bacterium RBG_16_59_8]|nr:MAG: septum formation protein Maf [Planctomycetes bacterium RBG_16_59_8]